MTLLLFIFGLKTVKAQRLSDEEREDYRVKRKRFRQKIRDAFAVWDDDDEDVAASPSKEDAAASDSQSEQ
ncbi:hypothetical protein GI364_12070 [Alicyclobacillus sp. SO9]|nr:hypothetical protein GI364_12070 [Alicyclobacillus sp. SO9]